MLILIEADPTGHMVALQVFSEPAVLLAFVQQGAVRRDEHASTRLAVYKQIGFTQPAIGSWAFAFATAKAVPLAEWVQRQLTESAGEA